MDILVNNAGIIKRQDAIEFTEENWDSVIQVNQKMVFFLSQAFAKQLMKQGEGGKIINVCSMLSYQGGIRSSVIHSKQECNYRLNKSVSQ